MKMINNLRHTLIPQQPRFHGFLIVLYFLYYRIPMSNISIIAFIAVQIIYTNMGG